MKYLKLFENVEQRKLKSFEIRNWALKVIIGSAQRDIGSGNFLEEFSEENKQKVIDEIDRICDQLEKKIKI